MAFTTIAAGSNGATLPQATINVASTTSTPFSTTGGTIFVKTTTGISTVTYTGTTSTTFTGCSGGTGTMATGNSVSQSNAQDTSEIFAKFEIGITPASISTDQTGMPSSGYFTNSGWGVQDGYDSQYSHGVNLFSEIFGTWPYRNASGLVNELPGGLTPYFQMVGYYVVGGVFESFVTVNFPAAATVVNPNTGHTLINTYVSSTWAI